MINHLEICNFKSIKKLQLNCRRINLFIGEPNTGKSNILEALGLVCWCGNRPDIHGIKDYVRFDRMNNLYYDGLLDEPIAIIYESEQKREIKISYKKDGFNINSSEMKTPLAKLSLTGRFEGRSFITNSEIMFYRFSSSTTKQTDSLNPLHPPGGSNLFMVAYASTENRNLISNIFAPYSLDVVFKPHEKVIEIQKKEGNIVTSYPYSMMSDTLQRIVFYLLAIKSNKNATLVFEEPEAHAFPYYTKYLGEIIAADTSNQYFIATHNPYLLNAIIEKAGKDDVGVCITYYKDYQTKVKQLGQDQLELLLDQDPFLAINQFIGE